MRITECVSVTTGANPTSYFRLDDGRVIHETSIELLVAYGLLENADEIETFRGEYFREMAYSLQGAEAIATLSEGSLYQVIEDDGIIAGKAFDLGEFEIPEGIKFVGKGGFQGLTCLTKIVIPSSVEVIEEDAFNGCSNLRTVVFNEGLRVLQHRAFANTNIEPDTLRLPNTIESISRRNVFPQSTRYVYVSPLIPSECRRALTHCGLLVKNNYHRYR